ncbi:hypothetical protein F5B22DRAFT_546273 [Xylaria bambusicola]|uniref:uncharacterized protein n=1 Tax=Xylaria bambusicola TaxID=326684 RepID=UPI002007260A|nr:uncharacterized protein F5B22DRAFT_546273 [Xylaria bambusicola]KAI0521668.1 hypothetical protein F5B22DRAFT_546273 [Xylaria bambusicola]
MSLTTEDEPPEVWVKVHRRKGRRCQKKPTLTVSVPSTLLPSPASLSLEQVKQDYDRIAGQWKSSSSFTQLQDLLSSYAASVNVNVATAICFGLGTFDPPDGAWEQKRKAHIQLAAFLSIVEHLQTQASHQIRCLFQEPILNSVDKVFIESLGHEVVESPAGFQLVDPKTLAFGVHLYRDIYSQVIATHIPAMFIGTSYGTWEDSHGPENLDWTRMKQLDQLCVKAKFPENQADTTFSSTTIHWRFRDES